jgi:hypothetical protein
LSKAQADKLSAVRTLLTLLVAASLGGVVAAHGLGSSITWNREISRIVFEKCASCHRPAGAAFSLMTYADVQPRANEIKEAVLARRMPPWGAVKGFGQFRNDQSLSQEQIELITKWVDGGIRRGNNPGMLPNPPEFKPATDGQPDVVARVSGPWSSERPFTLDGLLPERIGVDNQLQIVAVLPDGRIEPLLWLHDYDSRQAHPFLLRRPLLLPAGTEIRGVSRDALIALLRR